jgi:hypothetical protein
MKMLLRILAFCLVCLSLAYFAWVPRWVRSTPAKRI